MVKPPFLVSLRKSSLSVFNNEAGKFSHRGSGIAAGKSQGLMYLKISLSNEISLPLRSRADWMSPRCE